MKDRANPEGDSKRHLLRLVADPLTRQQSSGPTTNEAAPEKCFLGDSSPLSDRSLFVIDEQNGRQGADPQRPNRQTS